MKYIVYNSSDSVFRTIDHLKWSQVSPFKHMISNMQKPTFDYDCEMYYFTLKYFYVD